MPTRTAKAVTEEPEVEEEPTEDDDEDTEELEEETARWIDPNVYPDPDNIPHTP